MNCMQEARILTVMFQQGNDVVSFKEANFFPFYFFFFFLHETEATIREFSLYFT